MGRNRKYRLSGVWELYKQTPRHERELFLEVIRNLANELESGKEPPGDPVEELAPGNLFCTACETVVKIISESVEHPATGRVVYWATCPKCDKSYIVSLQ